MTRMIDRQLIASLVRILRRCQLGPDDQAVLEDAIRYLRAPRERCWRPNEDGLCAGCGNPVIAHMEAGCPTDAQFATVAGRVKAWHDMVTPKREAYQALRLAAEQACRQVRPDLTTADDLWEVEREADAAWGEYQATIRRANREA